MQLLGSDVMMQDMVMTPGRRRQQQTALIYLDLGCNEKLAGGWQHVLQSTVYACAAPCRPLLIAA